MTDTPREPAPRLTVPGTLQDFLHKASEDRLRLAASIASDLIYEWDLEYDGLEWFGDIDRILGFAHGELPRTIDAWVSRIHPEDRKRLEGAVERHRTQTTPIQEEYRIRRKDGTWLHWMDRGVPLLDDEGRPCKWIGVCTDVTAQKQASEAYRSLVENSIQGLIIFQDSRAVLANQAASTIIGYSKEEILAASPEEIAGVLHPEDRERVWTRMQDRIAGKPVPDRYAYRIVRKDGTERWVEINASLVEFTGKPAVQVSYMDITEAKRAEKELKESEERYRELVENANDAIFVAQDGRMMFHNRKTEEMIGYGREELYGAPFIELVHPDDRDMVIENHMRRLQGEQFDSTYSFRIIHKAGHSLWAQLNAALITWEGKPGVLCFIRDVNEQKRLEEQVRQKQRLESIGTLAGGIAHDFNNMLAAITGFTELALLETRPNTRLHTRLEEVLKAGKRAGELVNQILTFSRQSDEEQKPIRLQGILDDCLNMIRASLPATIEIRRRVETSSDMILGNPTQLHQVVINLFSNAAHAMGDQAGILEVHLTEEHIHAESAAENTELEPGAYLKLIVRDTGHGMEKTVADRVFDPFFTTKSPGEGTGMGLAVAHGIVKSHRGAISVQSKPGEGTFFSVLLPRFDQAGTAEEEPDQPLPAGDARILFVDDEPALAKLYEEMLDRLGYRVVARTSSLEALETFRADPKGFDLVITDLYMPNMNGLDLGKKLLEIHPHVPVILCSGFSEGVDGKKARESGIREMLWKPILAKDLAQAIHRVLEESEKSEKEREVEQVDKRVLIVEDDRQVRDMLKEVMDMEGYTTLEACDGKQGIRTCRTESVDLVITDIFMPEADGLQAIREIRKHHPETKIIAISGGGETVAGDFLRHAELFGAHRVFAKPLVLSELVGAVRDLLGDPRQKAASAA
jgi:PAS domain S-box-containing protein